MTIREQERTAKANYRFYEQSSDYHIGDAYGRYSPAKAAAWNYCERLCERFNGYGLKVIHHNTFIFTAGFESVDPDTGVVMFTYITPNYDITVEA